MTGTDCLTGLIDAAQRLGFLTHHETDSRRTNPGWPDLIVCGYGYLVAIETKSQRERLRPPTTTRRGAVLPGQADWLEHLVAAGVPTYVVRPAPFPIPEGEAGSWESVGYDEMLAILQALASGDRTEVVESERRR